MRITGCQRYDQTMHPEPYRVFYAPLRFFHTNPTGRIVNRFSKDQGIVDEWLPQVLFDALQSSFMVLGTSLLCNLTERALSVLADGGRKGRHDDRHSVRRNRASSSMRTTLSSALSNCFLHLPRLQAKTHAKYHTFCVHTALNDLRLLPHAC